MFFLLLLVGATVALPLQSQPEENLGDDVTEDAKRWGTEIDYRLLGILKPAPNLAEILGNLTRKNQSLSDDVTESGKRMFVEDNLWDDILQFAAEIAPIVAGPIGKRKLDPEPLVNYLPPSIYSSLIQIGLMPSKKDVEDNLWDDILQWAAEIDPVVNGPIGKRWCMGCLDPILTFDPTLLVTDILVTKLEGRRDVEDNLWDDILQWAAEIAPIVNGPILGKRLLDVDYNPNVLNPIEIVDPAITAFFQSLINTRDASEAGIHREAD